MSHNQSRHDMICSSRKGMFWMKTQCCISFQVNSLCGKHCLICISYNTASVYEQINNIELLYPVFYTITASAIYCRKMKPTVLIDSGLPFAKVFHYAKVQKNMLPSKQDLSGHVTDIRTVHEKALFKGICQEPFRFFPF